MTETTPRPPTLQVEDVRWIRGSGKRGDGTWELGTQVLIEFRGALMMDGARLDGFEYHVMLGVDHAAVLFPTIAKDVVDWQADGPW